MAIARTRVGADKKTGATTPRGIRALAEIADESSVTVTSESRLEMFDEERPELSDDV
ncbi:hypothetical protein BJ997_000980 [Cryobacterium roopkundense]|nr:hypothetical protein [Cryobacterium roopkundense]